MIILLIYPNDKKRELINFENNIKIARQTIYYHESTYDKTFLKRQEEIMKQFSDALDKHKEQ